MKVRITKRYKVKVRKRRGNMPTKNGGSSSLAAAGGQNRDDGEEQPNHIHRKKNVV